MSISGGWPDKHRAIGTRVSGLSSFTHVRDVPSRNVLVRQWLRTCGSSNSRFGLTSVAVCRRRNWKTLDACAYQGTQKFLEPAAHRAAYRATIIG